MNWDILSTAHCLSQRCCCRRRAGEGWSGRRVIRLRVSVRNTWLHGWCLTGSLGASCFAGHCPVNSCWLEWHPFGFPTQPYFCYQTLCSLLPPCSRLIFLEWTEKVECWPQLLGVLFFCPKILAFLSALQCSALWPLICCLLCLSFSWSHLFALAPGAHLPIEDVTCGLSQKSWLHLSKLNSAE